MAYPCEEIRFEPRQKTMGRNLIQRIIQPHSRLRQKIGGRLDHRQKRQLLLEDPHCIPFAATVIALVQVLLQRSREFIRQLTVVRQNDIFFYQFALHCTTSTSLKILLAFGSMKSPVSNSNSAQHILFPCLKPLSPPDWPATSA